MWDCTLLTIKDNLYHDPVTSVWPQDPVGSPAHNTQVINVCQIQPTYYSTKGSISILVQYYLFEENCQDTNYAR